MVNYFDLVFNLESKTVHYVKAKYYSVYDSIEEN